MIMWTFPVLDLTSPLITRIGYLLRRSLWFYQEIGKERNGTVEICHLFKQMLIWKKTFKRKTCDINVAMTSVNRSSDVTTREMASCATGRSPAEVPKHLRSPHTHPPSHPPNHPPGDSISQGDRSPQSDISAAPTSKNISQLHAWPPLALSSKLEILQKSCQYKLPRHIPVSLRTGNALSEL